MDFDLDFEGERERRKMRQLSREEEFNSSIRSLEAAGQMRDEDIENYTAELADKQAEISEREIEIAIKEYQQHLLNMVEFHRREAEKLQSSWVQQHALAEDAAQEQMQEMLATSELLKRCECYEPAIAMRDASFAIEASTLDIDASFTKQFEELLTRQRAQYDGLYQDLARRIELIKGEAVLEENRIINDQTFKQCLTPLVIYDVINEQPSLSSPEKSRFIRELSPSSRAGSGTPHSARGTLKAE